MVVDELVKSVRKLVPAEYARDAQLNGGAAASAYEGYALMKEKLEEAQGEMQLIEEQLACFWEAIRFGGTDYYKGPLNEIKWRAFLCACDMIQLAAMMYKTAAGVACDPGSKKQP